MYTLVTYVPLSPISIIWHWPQQGFCCASAAYVVMWCPSVVFVYPVKTIKRIFKIFSLSVSKPL